MTDIYVINVCTDTKSTDRYDKVAVNPYPVIVIGDERDMMEKLISDETKSFVKDLLRTQQLYDGGVFRIRHIHKDYSVDEFELSIPNTCKIEYN